MVVLSAILQIAIFPRLDVSFLAFVCFIPLLVLISVYQPWKLFLYYFLAGFIFHVGNLYWIYWVIQHYTALGLPLSASILALLCVVMALFWGLFGYLLGRFYARFGLAITLLLAPFLWITLEFARLHLTHFPWCLLGYSQYRNLRLAQFATFFGVYGLSWLLMTANSAITTAVVLKKYYYILFAAALTGIVVLYGHFTILKPLSGPKWKVGMIQANIPEDVKVNYDFAEQINEKHLRMSRELYDREKPDIIFWSESSTLFPLRSGREWTQHILDFAKSHHTPIVLGSDSFQGENIFNSAFLVNANGQIESDYSKMYLVPFGEFVPFQSILFFAGKVVPEISNFSPGTNYNLFSVNGKKFGMHICFEVVFPQLSREFCKRGASLLTTITNDAWFGKSSAPYQHFAMAVMRSIENRRYLVRCANTGISGIVDPYGRILKTTPIYVEAETTGEVQWVDEQTFYTRCGDVIVYLAIAITLIAILFSLRVEVRMP